MKAISNLIVLFILLGLSQNISAGSSTEKQAVNTKRECLTIEEPLLAEKIEPGDRPIPLNKIYLKKLFPELKNPRLMQYEDLDPTDKNDFITEGYVIVLKGDFNHDGFADLAFVGKYDNPLNPNQNSFFTILTFKDKKVTREYFSLIPHNQAFLDKNMRYASDNFRMTIIYKSGSDYCETIHWESKGYKSIPCKSFW